MFTIHFYVSVTYVLDSQKPPLVRDVAINIILWWSEVLAEVLYPRQAVVPSSPLEIMDLTFSAWYNS